MAVKAGAVEGDKAVMAESNRKALMEVIDPPRLERVTLAVSLAL